jgi:uncharacterized protein (DUF2236 family)
MIWRVNREAVVTLAGTCALLMQLAHPQVAAGVRDHSRFAEDTTGRLRRTLDLTMTSVFGPRPAALQAIRVINARHRTVNGPGYTALDPELLLWVHATLVYSALQGYAAFVAPLSRVERDGYYHDTKEIGVLLGIPKDRYPDDIDAFETYLWDMIDAGAVAVGDDARRMGRFVLAPRIPGVPAIAFAPLRAITAAFLPPPIRDGYRLRFGPSQRATFAAAKLTLPRLLRILPAPVRWLPSAREGYRRLGGERRTRVIVRGGG